MSSIDSNVSEEDKCEKHYEEHETNTGKDYKEYENEEKDLGETKTNARKDCGEHLSETEQDFKDHETYEKEYGDYKTKVENYYEKRATNYSRKDYKEYDNTRKDYRDYNTKDEVSKNPQKYLEDEITYSNLQISLIVFLSLLLCYVIYEHEYMHIQALRFYANMGDQDAQYFLGQRYYSGNGVRRDKKAAIYWFKEAAKQGHPYSSYNLAVAHLQGFHRLERKGEAHDLIKHAASSGIKDAERLLKTACAKGECDR